MSNKPIIDLKDDYMVVTGTGVRRNFMDIIDGTVKIYNAAKELNISRVIGDYRKVRYEVAMSEAFNLVRYYEMKLPDFYNISMASVSNPKDLEIAKFWEELCNKRGFNAAVFTDYNSAEKWILNQPINKIT
ncbi:hypothetical protein GCM10011506_32730 [Marivirga lumbricoides]|uniref:STAS/SEC14 domain-containing protein n=1 Tax=Marivirga lumbricoides TaxID=1046115 RepID=A0ABQ1MTI8_9BACT|nr:hypothetical protein GCM10011506_32730 [Marivirga lumbricoides]